MWNALVCYYLIVTWGRDLCVALLQVAGERAEEHVVRVVKQKQSMGIDKIYFYLSACEFKNKSTSKLWKV
jgi:hypothetical protein